MAKPHAGSRKRVEYAENEPATGNSTAISPSAWTVQYNMIPIREKAMSSEAGPPWARALPEPTKRPVPIGHWSTRPLKTLDVAAKCHTYGASDRNHL